MKTNFECCHLNSISSYRHLYLGQVNDRNEGISDLI